MSRFNLVFTSLLSFCSAVLAVRTFDAASDTNVAIYWGQGPNQARLVETCMNPNVDIVILAFVNVFPDNEGSGGYPGTNFGNACGAPTYTNSTGGATQLLSDCPDIGPDIISCQSTYGKKILLSLGGAYPTNYFIGGPGQAKKFAEFLWGAFGPVTSAWTSANSPRPFGSAVVDGFDFDIESNTSPVPTWRGKPVDNYMTRGYAKMITTFKNTLFPQDTSKSYYISGAPQCVVPDAHLGTVATQAWFDFMFIQFYNTPQCSARAGVENIQGNDTTNNISYDTWSQVNFFNPNVKLYIGLPAATAASGSSDYYLPPADAKTLLNVYQPQSNFGGVMLWEATYAANNVICGENYPRWIKRILKAVKNGHNINTTTNDCPDAGETCGTCPTIKVSKNGNCGANYGKTCVGSVFGSCCTSDGTCSSTSSDCSASCDPTFSDCSNSGKKLRLKRQAGAIFANSSSSTSDAATLPSGTDLSSSLSISLNTTIAVTADPVTTATTAALIDTTTAASASPTSDDPTVMVSSSTSLETIFQTVYITTVVEEITSTITLVEPVTTETIVVDVTVTAAAAADAGVFTTTVTTIVYEHLTMTVPSGSTVTSASTSTVEVEYNPAYHWTSTITLTTTTTFRSTITVTPSPSSVPPPPVNVFTNSTLSAPAVNTTTVQNVSTVLQYVTVVPIAADADVIVTNSAAMEAAVVASTSAAVSPMATGLVQASTGAGSREAGPWAPLAVVVWVCAAVILL